MADESKASEASVGKGLIPQMPKEPSGTETELKIHNGSVKKKVMFMNQKLKIKNKNIVSNNKGQVVTRFKPKSDIHKGVDNAGTVAFSADYRFPHFHPPKNN